MEVDIFDATKNQPETEWAQFKSIGDRAQGVYVGSRQAIDSYQNAQTVYELLDKKHNKIIQVAIRNTKKPVIEKMDKAFFGMIVGFVYTEDKKTKDGKSTFKSIDVKYDPKFFDAQWIEENKHAMKQNVVETPRQTPVDNTDAEFEALTNPPADVPFMTAEEYLKGIAELARTKLKVTDPSTVKDKVMEATDLAFTKANYEEIYERLKSM